MVHLRMQTPDSVCLLLDLLLLPFKLNFHTLALLGHLCILLSQSNDLHLQLGFILGDLSKFDREFRNLPAILIGDVREHLLHFFVFLLYNFIDREILTMDPIFEGKNVGLGRWLPTQRAFIFLTEGSLNTKGLGQTGTKCGGTHVRI